MAHACEHVASSPEAPAVAHVHPSDPGMRPCPAMDAAQPRGTCALASVFVIG